MLEIKKGKINAPATIAIYGVEGVGKTTLAAAMPGAVIIDVEKGSLNYDVARVTNIDGWEGLLNICRDLCQNAKEYHTSGVKTVVFDSLDAIEVNLLIPWILEKTGKGTLAEMEWGKGYELEAREFSKLFSACTVMKALGYNIVYIVHSTQKEINPPDNVPYSHYELKLNKKIAAAVKEYVDMLIFCHFKTLVSKDKNGAKGQAVERVMICNHTPYADAKNRYGLDTILPMDARTIAKYVGG